MGWTGRSVVAGAAVVLMTAVPIASASAYEIANWQMEEPKGATTMVNSSPSGSAMDGAIGSDVVLDEATPEGNSAYRFRGDWWIPNDNRLVQISDRADLDPGTLPFAIELRMKTGAHDPNITQKGQAKTSGGYWKFVLKKGWPRCHFRDSTGATAAIGFVNSTDPETKVDDNTWHVLRCERTATGVRATIDPGTPDEKTKFLRKTIGNINNDFPMTIGGKLACNYADVTCDYFAGVLDWVKIERPGI